MAFFVNSGIKTMDAIKNIISALEHINGRPNKSWDNFLRKVQHLGELNDNLFEREGN